jgi:DNA processing protein
VSTTLLESRALHCSGLCERTHAATNADLVVAADKVHKLPQRQEDDLREERIALLGLASIKGVGYWTLRKLYASVGLVDVLNAPSFERFRDLLTTAGAKASRKDAGSNWSAYRRRIVEKGTAMLEALYLQHTRVIFEKEPDYPEQLLSAPDWPRWLFVQGDVSLLARPSLALVGTRDPSSDGYFLTEFTCACLHYLKAPTISGLAEGIDTQVHALSLLYKTPTVAVLGTGILRNFPKTSTALRSEIIASGGAVVTEYLPNDSYSAENFVRRNRIQAALSAALVPLEWREKSGTAHTVRFAFAAGRPIAILRMPHWGDEHTEIPRARDHFAASVFTIPGDEEAFRSYLAAALRGDVVSPAGQQALFGDAEAPRRRRRE